ncbi:MAG: hypothetical protein M5U28_12765 [Sandaracinaceae bacterium]|nr:hypothetical protein [Sandaracinaceae bacterium]
MVFSDETLGNLEEADAESFAAIRQAFAYWDAIDIHYRGEVIRSRGHGFCGLSRKRLLGILQERARSLGVPVTFHTEVDDVERLRDCDLFVAADDVNSKVRARYEDVLRPHIDLRKVPPCGSAPRRASRRSPSASARTSTGSSRSTPTSSSATPAR